MARRGHGCRCCGCSFNNIFRCEQLSVNLWNQSGQLPVVTCDSAPAPWNLTAVSQWLTSGSFASGGSLTIDLDAAGLNLAASGTGNGFLQASLFQGTAIASSTISGGVRSISLNSGQRLAVLNQTHAISVRSCKVSSGRFVTAYAPATPRQMLSDIALTPRMSVKFWQQGEPGFTNQFIDGLWNSGGGNPYWMTQACRAAVYRDGEYVGEVTRDPSVATLLPDDETTVSQQSGSNYPDIAAEIAELDARMAAFNASLWVQRPLTPSEAQERETIQQTRQQMLDNINSGWEAFCEQNSITAAPGGSYISGVGPAPSIDYAIGIYVGFINNTWVAVQSPFPNGWPAPIPAAQQFLVQTTFPARVARTNYIEETQPRLIELNSIEAGYSRPMTPEEAAQWLAWRNEKDALQSSQAIFSVTDYTMRHSGIVRLTGYRASVFVPANGDATGGVNIAYQHQNHAFWNADTFPPSRARVVDRWYDTRATSAAFLYVMAGQRIRLSIGYGGDGTLATEPSGAILGTFDEATSPEGSYLVVSKYDDDCMPSGWQGPRNFDNVDDGWQGLGGYQGLVPRRLSQRRYEFNSFVVDKTPPSVVARQVDDFVVGDWPTEVNVTSADYFTGVQRVEAAPLIFADEPVVGDTYLAHYVTRPAVMGDPGFYRATNSFIKDRAHNFPLLTPSVEFTIHATMSGAKATFVATGDESISRSSPLANIDLVFDKPVVGVMKRHFTLQAYGKRADNTFGEIVLDDDLVRISPTNIVGLSWTSGNVCRITFDTTTQLPASLWRIVFQPDEAVFATGDADYRAKWSYIHTPPAAANGDTLERFEAEVWRVLRGDPQQPNAVRWNADEKKWKWRDEDANVPTPDDAQPCILAARFAWIRPQPESNIRQLIDTSTNLISVNQRTVDETVTIGDTASVSAAVVEPDPEQPPVMELSSSSTVSLPASGGSFHANHDADSFSPNAPPDPDAATAVPHSYFGMSTTIYPSPAKRLSLCAAPLEPQKHFSALMAANNFTTITASMNTHVPVNGRTYAGGLAVPDTTGRPHAQFSPNWEELGTVREGDQSWWGPPFLTRWFFGPFAMSPVDGGALRSQNQWAASLGTQTVAPFYGIVWNPPNINDQVELPPPPDWYLPFPPREYRRDNIGSMTVSIGASLVATRVVQEYRGIATAAPGDLVLFMRVDVSTFISATKTEYVPGTMAKTHEVFYPSWKSRNGSYEVAFHLSKSQEYALASGSAVQVVVPNTSFRRTPVPDPNSPFPGSIDDINRHVWTLQAS